MKVLCVCLGNICRSPAAQAVLERDAPGWIVDSAGTSDWHVGEPPYGPMQAAAKPRGLAMAHQRARQIKPADFAEFDLILVMDQSNLETVEALRPQGSATPVALLGAYGAKGRDVPDPYYTRDFDGCFDMIEACAATLISGTSPQP